jgi:hypothetical protein
LLYEIKFSHQNTELLHEIFSRQKKSNSIGDLSDFFETLNREKNTKDMLEPSDQQVISTRKRPTNDYCSASTSFANKRPRYEPNSKLPNTSIPQQPKIISKTEGKRWYYYNDQKNFHKQKTQKPNVSQGFKPRNVNKQNQKGSKPITPQNPKKQNQNQQNRKVKNPNASSSSNVQNPSGQTTPKIPKKYYYSNIARGGGKKKKN